jgi:hypothetical protein
MGEAHQVVQDEHGNAAQQQAEQQRFTLIGGGHSRGLQNDTGTNLVFGGDAQVDIERFIAHRQGQQVITAGQWRLGVDIGIR